MPARFSAANMAWTASHSAAAEVQPMSWVEISSDMDERRWPRTFWSRIHHLAYSGLATVVAASPVPYLTVLGGARNEPSRKPWRQAPAKLGTESAFHSMKLLPERRTAMVGITRVVEDADGGSMTGAEMAVEELGEVVIVRAEEVSIAAATARDRGGGGGEAARWGF